MRIKLDENIPVSLVAILNGYGHDIDTTVQEHLAGHTDSDIWAAAQREGRFLITQDLDFSDTRRFAPGTHSGILLVRLHTPSRGELVRQISELFASEKVAYWSGCFVVSTERKLRIRKPAE